MSSRTIARALLAVTLIGSAGCGSTAGVMREAGVADQPELSREAAGIAAPAGSAGLDGDTGTLATGTLDRRPDLDSTTAPAGRPRMAPPGQPSASTPGSTPRSQLSGRGFTQDTITLGYAYSSDLDTAYRAYNIAGESMGNTRAQMDALAKWVNSHGGIRGRQLKYVAYDISAADIASGNQSQVAEESCTAWTVDNKVFAVVQPLLGTAELRACLAKHDTPLIGKGDGANLDESEYRKYPSHLYEPAGMSTQTHWPLWVRVMLQGRYFTGWNPATGAPGGNPVKIGLLHPDNVDANKSAEVLKKSLAKAGHPVAEEVAYQGSIQGSSAGNQSAVLQFKSNGVTHVIGANLVFLQAASNQEYYPRYGLAALANALAANAPPKALAGAMAAGSSPAEDVDAAHDPGPPSTMARLCEEIMRVTNEDTRSGRAILAAMRTECDAIFLLKAALDAAPELSTAGLRAGVEGLGTALPSAQTWASAWGRNQHASGRALRLLAYDQSCSCFTYRGPAVSVR